MAPIRFPEFFALFRNVVLRLFMALCLLGLSFTASAQEARIITFDVPGAGTISSSAGCANGFLKGCYGTTPMANNNGGEIVGMYITDEGVYYGFLRSPEGKVSKLSEPNADTTPSNELEISESPSNTQRCTSEPRFVQFAFDSSR